MMKKFFTAIVFSIGAIQFSYAQLIDASPESQVVCGGTSATLTAVVTPPGTGGAPGSLPTTSYAISSIPYNPDPLTAGTPVALTDDSQTGLLPIGFNFCYFGNTYSQFIIGSNNWIGFQTGETSTWVTTAIPNAAGTAPRNTIMGPWQDINPGVGGTVTYALYGTAPFRRLSVSWNNVPMFSCTGQLYSSQIIIYETSNIIETHILNKSLCATWNSGNAVHGLHNATGTAAFLVPGRNNTQWTATNEGTRFTPNGAATYTINWYILPANTLIGTGPSITVVPPTSPQYYYAEVTGPNGCGTTGSGINTDTVVVLSSSLAADAGAYTSVCQGVSTTLSGSAPGASTYSWSPATGLSSTSISNPIATPSSTTTYTLTVVDGVGCTGTDTVTVGVHPAPFSDAGFGAGICPGDNIMLSASGAGTYSWSPAASLDNATIATPTATPAVTTTYTLTVTDGIGCTGTDTATVIVFNVPADAGPYTNLCIGASTTLNASGGVSYAWAPSTGLSATNIANPVANPTTTTTYTVNVTDVNGCSKSDTVTVAVHALPVADAGAFTQICSGNSTTLGASGGATYAWSPTSGLSSSTIFNPVASPTTTTTYSVIVTGASGCSSTDTVTVKVNPIPTVDAGPTLSICAGSSTTLNGTGASNYSWSPSTGLSNPSIANPVATPASPITYTLTGTTVYGCSAMDTMSIFLNGITVTTSAPVSICNGGNTTLTASGGTSYTWSPAASLSNATIANPVASPTATTTYTVIGTSGSGCADTTTVTVTVNPLPSVNAGATVAICNGATTTLNGSGALSYLWSPAGTLSNANIPNPICSATSTTLYTLTGTDVNGCVNTDTLTIVVKPLPTADAGLNTSICSGTTTTFNATGGVSYSWSPSTGLSNPSIPNPIASPSATTSYTVTVTGSNGCVNTDVVTVSVNASPTVTASADVVICPGASTVLNATGTGIAGYSWSPATGLSSTTVANPTANPTTTTTYVVTAYNATGCFDIDTVVVTINSTMSLSAATSVAANCGDANGAATLGTITGGTGPYTYTLNGGASQSSPTFTGLGTGTYTLTVTDAGGCTATETATVGSIPVLASFTPSPTSGTSPLPVSFTNTSTGASNYLWSFGDGGTSSTTNPGYTYNTDGTYTVILIADNGPGCVDTASYTINVFGEVVITCPNIFTPNGDGTNDLFTIQTMGIKSLEGTIYDRWGKKLATFGDAVTSGWDGKINGKLAADGTYFYIIVANGFDGKTYEEKGYLQLLGEK